MLVLDSSSSISQEDWAIFTKFTKDLVKALPIAPHFMHLGLVEFNSQTRLIAPLMEDMNALEVAIDNGLSTTTSGRTFTHLAVDQAHLEFNANGRAAPIPHVMVVLTDGLPTNRTATARAFRSAANAGISAQIITIGAQASIIETPADWSAWPVVHMDGGYAEVDARRQDIANLICRIAEVPATATPTELPTDAPSAAPTADPTNAPSSSPSEFPSEVPTETPTDAPSNGSPAPPVSCMTSCTSSASTMYVSTH
jgi:uncharacterized protein YegL